MSTWIEAVTGGRRPHAEREVFETLLEFAVHDLGARSIGATLVYRPDPPCDAGFEHRLPTPPPLKIKRPADLAPLRHVLAQIDGAALFDEHGTLVADRRPPRPEHRGRGRRGGLPGHAPHLRPPLQLRRPPATVIVVSEDGPVTVLKGGQKLGASAALPDTPDEGEADIVVGDHHLASTPG